MKKKWLWLGVPLASIAIFLMPAGAAPPQPDGGAGKGSTQVIGGLFGPADVKVVNGTNQPVPVAPQGTTQVGGTVNVGNLPAVQTVGGTVNVGNLPAVQNVNGTVNVGNFPPSLAVTVLPPGNPIQLKGFDAAFSGNPIDKAFLERRDPAGFGQRELHGRFAVSSLTITMDPSSTPGKVDMMLIAEHCDGGFIGSIGPIWVEGGETVHLTFPTPVLLPDRGPEAEFCLNAYVNDDDTAQYGSEFLMDVMGYEIPS